MRDVLEKGIITLHYITVLSSPLSGCVIDVSEHRDKASCKSLLKQVISKDNRDKVDTVSMDMWKAYMGSVREVLPQARTVHDRFHLIKYLNDAIDKVRRREVKTHEELKNTRFLLLKNKANLTDRQRIVFEHIEASNYEVGKAWGVRENFKDIIRERLSF